MAPEIEMLNADLDRLEKMGEAHDQGHWIRGCWSFQEISCSTAACLAGWRVIWSYPNAKSYANGDRVSLNQPHISREGRSSLHWSVSDLAADLYGLTVGQADWLFDYSNTIPQMKAMVAYLAAHPDASGDEMFAEQTLYERYPELFEPGADAIERMLARHKLWRELDIPVVFDA